MCHYLNGKPYVPTKSSAVFVAVALLVLGVGVIFLLSIAPQIAPGQGVEKLLFAGFLIIVGLGWSFLNYTKAEAYEAAQGAYLRKKEAARSKYEGQAESQR